MFHLPKTTSQAAFSQEMSLPNMLFKCNVVFVADAGMFFIKQNVASSNRKQNTFPTILFCSFAYEEDFILNLLCN